MYFIPWKTFSVESDHVWHTVGQEVKLRIICRPLCNHLKWGTFKNVKKQSMVVHAFNPSTQEVGDMCGPLVQVQPGLHRETVTNKTKQNKKHKKKLNLTCCIKRCKNQLWLTKYSV
jgi:hypothetical protein